MRQWMVDAFASAPFRGNPACVVEPLTAWPHDSWMQALAAENNQAETAFLLSTDEPSRFSLRWFTPKLEVPLCGHATLASAHVVMAELGIGDGKLVFDTLSAALGVVRRGEGYEMDFPALTSSPIPAPSGLAEALGAQPREVWLSDYMVAVLSSENEVRRLDPNIAALSGVAVGRRGAGNIGVAALADSAAPYDVVSRFFAPGSGVDEDPTTGSLHCILAPLFALTLGRKQLRFHQAYPGRGGDIECEVAGDRVH
ncbi:MAG: PhzF family phenazine biosynthesis protein, partial [Caulobacteraceae bacterium]